MQIRPSPFPAADREKLGYREHSGSISVARSTGELPIMDWDAIIARERSHTKMLLHLNMISIEYGLHCFAIDGRLPQHTDCVGPCQVTSGMILHCGADLELNSGGKRIAVGIGDQFILNPHVRHGAETTGRLIFAALDEDRHKTPSAAKSRALFLKKLERMARDHPITKTVNKDEQGS